jgi:hypothetical protein
MARQKRNSVTLEKAKRRLESLRSIDPNLDLGGDLTVRNFENVIHTLDDKLGLYNTSLSEVDKQGDDVKVAEKVVNIMSEKMLLGVGSLYGKTSQEYDMAGGSRRKSRVIRQKARSDQPSNSESAEP